MTKNNQLSDEIDNEEDMPAKLASVSFEMLETGDVDVRVLWTDESQESANGLSTLLTEITLAMFTEHILKLLQEKIETSEDEVIQLFAEEVLRQWMLKVKMVKGGTKTIKPSMVFRGIRAGMGID